MGTLTQAKGLEDIASSATALTGSGLVSLAGDIDLSSAEKGLLARIVKRSFDLDFVREIIRRAAANPSRNHYPSVDLGAFDDLEHGLLFGATRHLMIDPRVGEFEINGMIRRLQSYGADIESIRQQDNTTIVSYNIGDQQRQLEAVGMDAAILATELKARLKKGISALIMKGRGGYRGADGYSNILEALEFYITFLKKGGLLLTGVPPKMALTRLDEGILPYWSHSDGDYRLNTHGLYQR